jgi:threonine aldolase
MIDLRSDTVTRPTEAMRRAMAAADVGDDVFGDDPTVNRLEQRVAELLGKEAAVYMPSGTMTNQVALRTHTEPGDEVILEAESHVYFYEAGAPGALSGVMCRLIPGQRGIVTAADLRGALRPWNQHYPVTKLVCIENTHNRGGGSVWSLEAVAEVSDAARAAGLKCHLDGARLWNACIATGTPEREYARHFDSVSVCFSKGLGAPVGSALAGSREFIARSRRFRKQFGGGMRQAGVIAAGALHALEHHRERLAVDHENARLLGARIEETSGLGLAHKVETNILVVKVDRIPAEVFIGRLKESGVLVTPRGADTFRAVTHLDVTREQVLEAADIMRRLVSGGSRG